MLNLNPIELTEIQKEIIRGFGELRTEYWNKNQKRLRDAIREELKRNQKGKCVYCGCRVHETGDVEHILNKARYPQFMFTPRNLAFACRMCNEEIKGAKNIIVELSDLYEKCTFAIVHPYLDDVDIYFDKSDFFITIKPGLSAKEKEKAKKTIELLQYHSVKVLEKRAEYMMAMGKCKETNKTIEEIVIERILMYTPYHHI